MRASRIPTRGHRAHRRPAPPAAATREQILRAEAERDPVGLVVRIRREHDETILANKRDMARRGLDRDCVLAVVVNPRVDPGEGMIATAFDAIPRDEVVAMSPGPELASLRESLRHPPKPGHVWVLIPVPGQRLLVEEPVEHTVTEHGATPPAGDA